MLSSTDVSAAQNLLTLGSNSGNARMSAVGAGSPLSRAESDARAARKRAVSMPIKVHQQQQGVAMAAPALTPEQAWQMQAQQQAAMWQQGMYAAAQQYAVPPYYYPYAGGMMPPPTPWGIPDAASYHLSSPSMMMMQQQFPRAASAQQAPPKSTPM